MAGAAVQCQVEEREVCAWVSEHIAVASWPISSELAAAAERAPATPPAAAVSAPGAALSPPAASARAASTLPTLRRLRVASFERLVREVLRVDPGSTRASILLELDAAGERVRWLGRSVVFLRSDK